MKPAPACCELLTRTSLQLDGPITESSAERVAKTLRRVPGVLLAEVDATSGHVTVAHDEAVAMQSLLAGVQSAGCHATTVIGSSSSRSCDTDAVQRRDVLRKRHLLTIGSGLLVAIVLVGVFAPNAAYKQWLLVALALPAWSLYFAHLRLRRHRP